MCRNSVTRIAAENSSDNMGFWISLCQSIVGPLFKFASASTGLDFKLRRSPIPGGRHMYTLFIFIFEIFTYEKAYFLKKS
jgi:hypothetical protein